MAFAKWDIQVSDIEFALEQIKKGKHSKTHHTWARNTYVVCPNDGTLWDLKAVVGLVLENREINIPANSWVTTTNEARLRSLGFPIVKFLERKKREIGIEGDNYEHYSDEHTFFLTDGIERVNGLLAYRKDLLGEDFSADMQDNKEPSERKYYDALARPHQAKFRKNVFAGHGTVCAITGCVLPDALEAAHIEPYSINQNDNPNNGLPLRRDIHRLFDLNKIAIDPNNLTIHFEPELENYYRTQVLRKAVVSKEHTDFTKLVARWKKFPLS